MKLEIDSSQVIKEKLDLNDYFFLYCLHVKDIAELKAYIKVNKISVEAMDKLKNLGYITNSNADPKKYSFDSVALTQKFENDFIPKKKLIDSVDDWFDQWYDLWPKGVKSGGYPLRNDRTDCLNKMKKFTKEYPQYSKGVIIGATSKYLSFMKQKNYAYCKLASYLIYKDGSSLLSGMCEEFHTSVNSIDLENNEQGKTSLGTKDF